VAGNEGHGIFIYWLMAKKIWKYNFFVFKAGGLILTYTEKYSTAILNLGTI